jgi:lysylphosphatidylglycerol synthetase-like protein (DUF2156 family)
MPEQPQNQPENWSDLPNVLILAGLVVAVVSVVFTFGTELRWIGHAVTGIIGLILMVFVIFSGAAQKGRIRAVSLYRIYRYHKTASTWFSLFVTGTFVLGLLTTMEHGEPLLESPHGIVGLVLVFMAVIQLVPSLLIRRRARIQVLHRVVGYTIVPVFMLQTVLGLSAAGILGVSAM